MYDSVLNSVISFHTFIFLCLFLSQVWYWKVNTCRIIYQRLISIDNQFKRSLNQSEERKQKQKSGLLVIPPPSECDSASCQSVWRRAVFRGSASISMSKAESVVNKLNVHEVSSCYKFSFSTSKIHACSDSIFNNKSEGEICGFTTAVITVMAS